MTAENSPRIVGGFLLVIMKVHITTPYSIDKNLGQAYNAAMELIPDGDAACFIDGDVAFLTPDYGHILNEYANAYPDNVLVCYTNRIHQLSKYQLHPARTDDIGEMIILADYIKSSTTVTPVTGPVSGFLMVVPKSIWNKHRFIEHNIYRPGEHNLLGCDNEWTNRVRAAGVGILRMDGLLVWHTYRLLDGSKKHLL